MFKLIRFLIPLNLLLALYQPSKGAITVLMDKIEPSNPFVTGTKSVKVSDCTIYEDKGSVCIRYPDAQTQNFFAALSGLIEKCSEITLNSLAHYCNLKAKGRVCESVTVKPIYAGPRKDKKVTDITLTFNPTKGSGETHQSINRRLDEGKASDYRKYVRGYLTLLYAAKDQTQALETAKIYDIKLKFLKDKSTLNVVFLSSAPKPGKRKEMYNHLTINFADEILRELSDYFIWPQAKHDKLEGTVLLAINKPVAEQDPLVDAELSKIAALALIDSKSLPSNPMPLCSISEDSSDTEISPSSTSTTPTSTASPVNPLLTTTEQPKRYPTFNRSKLNPRDHAISMLHLCGATVQRILDMKLSEAGDEKVDGITFVYPWTEPLKQYIDKTRVAPAQGDTLFTDRKGYPLSKEYIEDLLNVLDPLKAAFIERAIFKLYYDTELDPEEIAALNLEDLELETEKVKITFKGKPMFLNLNGPTADDPNFEPDSESESDAEYYGSIWPESVKETLMCYLAERVKPIDRKALFTSPDGKRISTKLVNSVIKRCEFRMNLMD